MNTLHHPQCQAFEEIIAKQKEEIDHLVKEAKRELKLKDKRIAHLESEVSRLFEPTRAFWNSKQEEIIAKQKEEIEELRELALNLRGIVSELIDVAEVHADYTFEKINSCDDIMAKLNLCEKESV
jgi:hypothetical protein